MRRLFILVGLALVFVVPAPVAAHDPAKRCTVSVDPGRGGPKDVYRITGRQFPRETNGGSLEVQIAVSRVVHGEDGPRLKLKQLMTAFLIPDVHTWYVDYNVTDEQSATRLRPGHYVVAVETPHQAGCRTTTGFDVRRGG